MGAIIPLMDAMTGVVLTGLEALKGEWTLKISKINYEIQKIGDESTSSRKIGFITPKEEDDNND